MEFYVFDRSVVGYKNIIKNKSSQDYLKVEKIEGSLICTVSDGHSDDFFTRSYKGSKFACEAFIEVLKKYINEDINKINYLLESKTLQKEIYNYWRSKVDEDIQKFLPRVFKYNYLKYGTTLLGVLIKKDFILYMKLGDGNILLKRNNQIEKVLSSPENKMINSMADKNSYENMIFKVEENKKDISDVIIFSDGFENSFTSFNKIDENISKTISQYNKNIFLKYKLEKTYDNYLSNLSKNNSFDDISIIFVNIMY